MVDARYFRERFTVTNAYYSPGTCPGRCCTRARPTFLPPGIGVRKLPKPSLTRQSCITCCKVHEFFIHYRYVGTHSRRNICTCSVCARANTTISPSCMNHSKGHRAARAHRGHVTLQASAVKVPKGNIQFPFDAQVMSPGSGTLQIIMRYYRRESPMSDVPSSRSSTARKVCPSRDYDQFFSSQRITEISPLRMIQLI